MNLNTQWERLRDFYLLNDYTDEVEVKAKKTEFFKAFEKSDIYILSEAINYWFRHLDKGKYPYLSTIQNIYNENRYKNQKTQEGWSIRTKEYPGGVWTTDRNAYNKFLIQEQKELILMAEKHGLPFPCDTEEKAIEWRKWTIKHYGNPAKFKFKNMPEPLPKKPIKLKPLTKKEIDKNLQKMKTKFNQDLIDDLNKTE